MYDEELPPTGAEQHLAERGIELVEAEELYDSTGLGHLIAFVDQDPPVFGAYIRPGMTAGWRDLFAEAVDERIVRLLNDGLDGPAGDLWQERSDGGYQVSIRPVQVDPWLLEP